MLVPGASFEQLLAVPEVEALAGVGGAGLLANATDFTVPRVPAIPPERLQQPREDIVVLDPKALGGLAGVGREIRRRAEGFPTRRLLVLVLNLDPSPATAAAKDDLPPLVMAEGSPDRLFTGFGPPRALTSDSTRRDGVVTGGDVQTTIVHYLAPSGSSASGSEIRVIDAPAPFELHARYLAMRRMTVPVQTAAGIYVTIVGLVGVLLLVLRRRIPTPLSRLGGWAALTVIPLATALLAAGHLTRLSYATVVPFVIGIAVVGVLLVVPLQRFGTSVPTAVLGGAVLVFFVVEAALGWTAALTPFLGGSELDGGRFYGLPNVSIGLLAGCALFVAVRLGPVAGWLLVGAAGLFAGLPSAGSNLGASVTLFAAAGIWLAVRRWGRFGWRPVLAAVATVAIGTGIVLLAHRFLSSAPTHVTRFEETAGRSLSGIWGTVTDRFLVGWRLILRNPFALVPVVGVPVTLVAALWPPDGVREALERHRRLRDAIVVTLVAGLIAVLPNDSWPAAMGLTFGLGLGGLLYVSLAGRHVSVAGRTGMMGER